MVRAFLENALRAADEMLLDLTPPIFDSADFKAGVQAVVKLGSKSFRGTGDVSRGVAGSLSGLTLALHRLAVSLFTRKPAF